MKIVVVVALCLMWNFIYSQRESDSIKIFTTRCFTKLSKDSTSLDIKITIVNNSNIDYFYPKAFEQNINGKSLYQSYKYSGYRYKDWPLSFDVSSQEYNSYDTLIAIKPNDTLIVAFNDLLLTLKEQKFIIQDYITPTANAIKSTKGGEKYLDRYVRGIKVIEYTLTHRKDKITENALIKNYIILPGKKR